MISILMPYHNDYEFLDDSIRSILSQTYCKFELIIGLNGLTKKEIAKAMFKVHSFNDKRIKVINCNTKGKVKTLNKLVYFAKFKYICLIDADDKWKSNKLEEQIKYINKYDIIGSDIEYFGEKTGSPGLFLGKITEEMFRWQNPIANSTVMMKKEDAYWDESWEGLDDFNMWLKLLKNNKVFFNVPEILVEHRIHTKSHFNNKNTNLANKVKETLPPLTEEEITYLTEIFDNKKWLE